MKNKLKIIFSAIVLLAMFSTTCFAATTSSKNAKLEIVENNVCTINIQDTATFEKKISSYDLEKKEINLQLTVTNTADEIFNKPTEVMFVLDNSLSMRENEVSNGVTRMDAVTESAKKLANSLLTSKYVKIGVVSFSTDDDNRGQLTDARLITSPSNDSNTVISAITSVANSKLGSWTDIEAGLTLGGQSFTNWAEDKYIILLTDGFPNVSLGSSNIKYSGDTAKNTLNKINSLKADGIKILAVMTGVNGSTVETQSGLTYKKLAEEVFGTEENPTVERFYFIDDSKIENTIANTILSNIKEETNSTLTNLKIYDYFPQEIINNFDFSYVAKPTKGDISADIDLQNNMIVWTIPELKPQETATVTYKLKLKDNIETEILDKILNTNAKIDITADQIKTDDGSNILTSDVTPKVKVTKPEKPEQPKVDNTVANTVIPQTGSGSFVNFIIAISVISLIVSGIRYYLLYRKDVK